METKLAELEDRSRRNNICVPGLPEGKEGPNVTQFLTNQMPLWFPTLRDAPAEFMRAHRIGPPCGNTTAKPRVLIFVLDLLQLQLIR